MFDIHIVVSNESNKYFKQSYSELKHQKSFLIGTARKKPYSKRKTLEKKRRYQQLSFIILNFLLH